MTYHSFLPDHLFGLVILYTYTYYLTVSRFINLENGNTLFRNIA